MSEPLALVQYYRVYDVPIREAGRLTFGRKPECPPGIAKKAEKDNRRFRVKGVESVESFAHAIAMEYRRVELDGKPAGPKITARVYGYRPSVTLEFVDSAAIEKTGRVGWTEEDLARLVESFRQNGAYRIVDAKLVSKRPSLSAGLGPKIYLKIYGGASFTPHGTREYLLRTKEKNEFPGNRFSTYLHDSALPTATKWRLRRGATGVGYARVPETATVGFDKNTSIATLHEKDVEFETGGEEKGVVADAETASRWTMLLNEEISQTIKTIVASSRLIGFVEKRLTFKQRPHDDVSSTWTRSSLKRRYVGNIFGVFRSDRAIADLTRKALNEARDFHAPALNANESNMRYELTTLEYALRRCVKGFWQRVILAESNTKRADVLLERARRVSRSRRYMAFDIESSYRPHCKETQTVTAISTVVFTHETPSKADEMRVFARRSGRNDDSWKTVDRERILARCRRLVDAPVNGNRCKKRITIDGDSFELRLFADEKSMLLAFFEYARTLSVDVVTGFNSDRFDLPFIADRLAVIESREAIGTKRDETANRPATLTLPFVDLRSTAKIKYARRRKLDKKSADKDLARRMYGSRTRSNENSVYYDPERNKRYTTQATSTTQLYFRQYKISECKGFASDDDSDDSGGGGDNDDDENITRTIGADNTIKPYFRAIRSISSDRIAFIDAMGVVSKDRNRGCRLDDAAKEFLGIGKVDDDRVKHGNLRRTWEFGSDDDLETFVAYSLIDSLLVWRLIVEKNVDDMYCVFSVVSGISLESIAKCETTDRVYGLFAKYGHHDDVMSVDPSFIRDDSPLFAPGYVYREKDFQRLKPCAGRTNENKGLFYAPHLAFDVAASYPSIMASRNVCVTSYVDRVENLRALNEGIDYVAVNLRNVVPRFDHVCDDCPDDIARCKFKRTMRFVEKRAYFLTIARYESLARTASIDLTKLRSGYKKKGDDSAQLAIKLLNNSIYGVMLRVNPIVGGTITHYGREDIAAVAKMALHGFGVTATSGDTDSHYGAMTDARTALKLSALAKFLGYEFGSTTDGRPPPTVHDIYVALYAMANRILLRCNGGVEIETGKVYRALYPEPTKIELEKIFTHIMLLFKKKYFCTSILPDYRVVPRNSGRTKGLSYVTIKLERVVQAFVARRDLEDLVEFIGDLYDVAGHELTCEESARAIESSFVDRGDRASLSAFLNRRDAFIRNRGGGNVPLEYLTSDEKVTDLGELKTPAAKRARVVCYTEGVDSENAPAFIDVVRSSKVNIATFSLTTIGVILAGPESKDDREKRERREDRLYGAAEMRLKRARESAKELDELAKKAVPSRLHVTTMPAEYRSGLNARYEPTPTERRMLTNLKAYIEERENAVDEARKAGFPESNAASVPAKATSQTWERVFNTCETVGNGAVSRHPAPAFVDRDFALSSFDDLERLRLARESPSRRSYDVTGRSVRLWDIYVSGRAECRFRYARFFVDSETARGILELRETGDPPENCDSVIGPQDAPDDSKPPITAGLSVAFDLDEYAQQTRRTPFLITGYGDDSYYATNSGSYIQPELDSLRFEIAYDNLVDEFLYPIEKNDTSGGAKIIVRGVAGESTVRISINNVLSKASIVRITRADGGETGDRWPFNTEPVAVNAFDFTSFIRRKVLRRSKRPDKVELTFVRVNAGTDGGVRINYDDCRDADARRPGIGKFTVNNFSAPPINGDDALKAMMIAARRGETPLATTKRRRRNTMTDGRVRKKAKTSDSVTKYLVFKRPQ